MKTNIAIAALTLVLANSISAQDVKEILSKTYDAQIAIEGGYYERTKRMKSMTETDTTERRERTWFKKIKNDSCFGFAFHTNYWNENKYGGYVVYTGNELVTGSDSSGTIRSVDRFSAEIENIKHNYDTYDPFTNPELGIVTKESLSDEKMEFRLEGEDTYLNTPCYRVWVRHDIRSDSGEMMQILNATSTYWISKDQYHVLQFANTIELLMGLDTMVQYDLISLDTYDIHTPVDTAKLSLNTFPSYYTLKDYTPRERMPLLANETQAPGWHYPGLTDSVRLEDFKGKLVLLDFFYRSCYPCMQAIPALQSLHEKYKDQGLIVIGVNPYDTNDEAFSAFLKKRNVSYTVVFSDKELPKAYQVSGYPTLYLIDKNGMIVHGSTGYGPGTEGKLESLISMHLKHMN
jgi:thiol-disulfide isomerase/thioredoxin